MFLQDVDILVVVLYLCLCGEGCVSNISGIGPGFFSMSPLLSNISELSNVVTSIYNSFLRCILG